MVIQPGKTASLPLTFRPTRAQAYTGSLTLTTGDRTKPTVTVRLSGTGF